MDKFKQSTTKRIENQTKKNKLDKTNVDHQSRIKMEVEHKKRIHEKYTLKSKQSDAKTKGDGQTKNYVMSIEVSQESFKKQVVSIYDPELTLGEIGTKLDNIRCMLTS